MKRDPAFLERQRLDGLCTGLDGNHICLQRQGHPGLCGCAEAHCDHQWRRTCNRMTAMTAPESESEDTSSSTCPNCGKTVPAGADTCPFCGCSVD